MAHCLIALGSNLGDRAGRLQAAFAGLASLPATRLVARSGVHATRPIGGPAGQQDFLNAAALVDTELPPRELLDGLQLLEKSLGREPNERWAARTLDLDILLYGDQTIDTPELTVPHPRMAYRRFVLAPAAEAAPWMIHPDSGWTISGLLHHLESAAEAIAVTAMSSTAAEQLSSELIASLSLPGAEGSSATGSPAVQTWARWKSSGVAGRPRLVLALLDVAGVDRRELRKILHLPPTGPVAWIDVHAARAREEAIAAVQAVWPALS